MQCHAETTAQLPGRHIASAGGIVGGSALLTAFAMNESKRTRSSSLSSSLSGELAPCEPDEYFEGPEFDPAQRHVTVAMGDLALPVSEGGRIIFVGDVHGCFDELQELLETAQRDPARDTRSCCWVTWSERAQKALRWCGGRARTALWPCEATTTMLCWRCPCAAGNTRRREATAGRRGCRSTIWRHRLSRCRFPSR